MKKEPKHFEGEEFEIRIIIDSDACFSSFKYIVTDYNGFKRICDLLNELDPPRQSEE